MNTDRLLDSTAGESRFETALPLPLPAERERPLILRRRPKAQRVVVPRPSLTGTQKESHRASWWAAAARLLHWSWLLLKFFVAMQYDRLRRRERVEQNALRLRLMFQRMGPTAVKIGQQLSVRIDLLPGAYCRELERLLDSAPPFPTAEAIAVIERETERPLSHNFQAFDPVPIGSASLACVFKAELLTGQPVAIKVRRPDVAARLTADLKAIMLLARFLDLMGPVKVEPIVSETARMLLDELNFKLEAQQLLYFQKAIKHQKKISVPKVYYHLCSRQLLVAEFVSGVSMVEILKRAGSDDLSQRAQLDAEGYDCLKIARRLARFFYWELFDSVFFHADPHPGNIIVRPDNRICLIDFGSCGSLPTRLREALLDFNLAISRHDIEEATRCLRLMHEPLPPLDFEAYVTEMRGMVQKTFLEITNEKANWRERTVSVAFSESIAIARKYKIPMNVNLLRYFRMIFLSDTILFRLHPRFNHQQEVIAWYAERREKLNRMVLKRCRRRDLCSVDLSKLEGAQGQIEQFAKRIKGQFEDMDRDFRATISKSSFAATVVISFVGRSAALGVLMVLVRAAVYWMQNRPPPHPSIVDHFNWLISQPTFILLELLMAAHALYRIHSRARQIDEDES